MPPHPTASSSSATPTTSPPGTVLAAAVVTWVATAASVLASVAYGMWLTIKAAAALQSPYGATALWWVYGLLALAIACSALAAVAAFLTYRGHGWARWALITLAALTALAGPTGLLGGLALLQAGSGVAVVALLLLPDSRAWFSPAPGLPAYGPK